MTTIKMKDAAGKSGKSATLQDAVFKIEPNMAVMHQVVRSQRAAWRSGTSNTLTRAQVRGGGKKPWRQKGTGRARQGTIRAPHWTGGGVVFGPHPRSYEFRVNKKEIKLALRSALSAKLADKQFSVVESFSFEKPCTKDAAAFIKAMGFENQRTTVIVGNDDVNAYLSFRNLPKVNVFPVCQMNTYELIDNKQLVVTEEALKYIQEVLA